MRGAVTAAALVLALAGCGPRSPAGPPTTGGGGASGDVIDVPVRIAAGDVVRYRLDWGQESTSGAHDSGAASWHAELELRGLDAAAGPAQAELLQFTVDERAETRRTTLRFAPDGTVADVGAFALPVGFSVVAHGVAGKDLLAPRDWAQCFLRTLPSSALRGAATWDFPALFDGLPVARRVVFHAHVASVDAAHVVVEAQGDVDVPQVDDTGRHVAEWLREATCTATAHIVVSRHDGLVEELETELVIDAPRHWDDAPGAAEPRPVHMRNHTRFARVR